ncbi:hypothetical protein, variant 1 [Aphanomyces astaci]|uniref:Uncharacterized protein n=1 Tax=Aphanomyces astaci TaxID=112090 RepID=W4H931_APHAT|nr:hypothetical protein, variant 1 [Aphanomyces astaci]ETV87598.1 hypothetical protein, variant 1 [Aphanomyces astaci]|eukprot:XP_009822461.1 hypothetical protein, variant 1 [Aphanomyces astaci]
MHHMDESSSVPQDTSVYLEDDAMDLVTKGYLTQEKWLELGSGDLATAKEKIRQYINEQLNDSVRLALTKQPTDQVLHSDIIAAAAGGLWGAASAWLKSTPILNPPPQVATRNVIDPAGPSEPRSSTFLWNTAKEAALKSMETSRKIRTVDFLQLSHYCGDELSCDHIVIAINGFMTHGHTPTVNWEAIGRKKNVSGYVVLWEAGNAAEWDAFCNETSVHLETGQDDTIASHFTVGNPWNKAQNKAHQVGIVLAELLISTPVFSRSRKVTLVGHSLGSTVIHSCLQHLNTHNRTSNNTPLHLHQAVNI